MPNFTKYIKLGPLRDLKAFLYLKAGVTRGETPDEQNREIDLGEFQMQNGRLARMNSRALANRPFLKPDYEYRPASTHSKSFQALKKKYPYFGYIAVEIEDVRPFLMFSSNDDRVAQTYFFYGANAFESLSLRIWRELARGSKHIFDIGAFTGVYSLTAAYANDGAQVYAFEPIKRIYSRLLDNLKVNRQARKVKAFDFAMSNTDGEAKINLFHGHLNLSSGSSLLPRGGKEVHLREHVETMRFDTFVEVYAGAGVDLVKIDVEQAESLVIEGMSDTLGRYRPNLLVEVFLGDKLRSLVDMLSPHGYSFAVINEERQEAIVNDFKAHTMTQNVLFSPLPPDELKRLCSLKPLPG